MSIAHESSGNIPAYWLKLLPQSQRETELTAKIVAVTGASGFIGQHVCNDLLRNGFSVRALARTPAHIPPEADIRLINALDVEGLKRGFDGADAVIHLAGRAHVMRQRARDDSLYEAVNEEGTRAVAEAAIAASVPQILFTSSVKAIGEGGHSVLRDDSPERPLDAYGRSKLAAERLLVEAAGGAGITVTILRLPLVYGPGVKGNFRRLLDAVWRGVPVPVSDQPNARSMLGVGNLTEYIRAVLRAAIRSHRTFLLSDGAPVSTEDLLKAIGRSLGKRARVVKLPLGFMLGVGAIGDTVAKFGVPVPTSDQIGRITGSLVIDSSAAWAAVGMSPPISFDAGIAAACAWYLNVHAGRESDPMFGGSRQK